jgi:hypothetical protein
VIRSVRRSPSARIAARVDASAQAIEGVAIAVVLRKSVSADYRPQWKNIAGARNITAIDECRGERMTRMGRVPREEYFGRVSASARMSAVV